MALASRGIGVAPGSPFQLGPADGPHVRITTARVADGFEDLAGHLADAAGVTTHRSLPA